MECKKSNVKENVLYDSVVDVVLKARVMIFLMEL